TRIVRAAAPAAPQRYAEDDDIENVVFTVRPTLLFVKIGYVAAIVGAIVLTILLAMISFIDIPIYLSLPIALALLLIPAYYHIKRNMIRYTLTDSKVEIDYGLIARTTRNVPLSKIQDVTVSASIPQRILGFGDVVIDNASEFGGSTILHNINNPRHYADLLLRELRRWH
ncbi:MAG TPA: PH domain-containing protein, partial [Pyrinomonadaceae bacterium]|nr:PH domain-containing protein [Pyrinomonadaceae bacterium]